MIQTKGKVYLVGAGPGDAAYLTARSQHLLAHAEVLVCDALADIPHLQLPPNCLQLNVGKRGGQPSMQQSEINRLLVEHCHQGKQVVRLKSGDPFIFGRTASEIEALKAAECEFEIVPGISTALAAPLLAGIPLTDPVMSRCFAVMSGHDPDDLHWEALVQIETLVILMGGRTLAEIVHQLRRHGRSNTTPVAIIRECSRPSEKIWIGNLANILDRTAGESLSPCVIILGEVVRMREYLQPTAGRKQEEENSEMLSAEFPGNNQPLTVANSQLPLADKTILVTRAAGQSSQFSDRLWQAGAQVIEMPTLVIGPPTSWDALDRAIAQLDRFNWLILTSTNGVDYFFDRLSAQGKDPRALAGIKIAVVGKKTAESLRSHGLIPDFIPPDFIADSLVAHFPDRLEGCQILFPRVESGGREMLVRELTAKGAQLEEVPAYESRCPEAITPSALAALQNHTVHVITFASSKTVQNFCHLVETTTALSQSKDWLEGVCIASIGPETSKTCQNLLGRLDVEAKQYTLEGLATAICEWAIQD